MLYWGELLDNIRFLPPWELNMMYARSKFFFWWHIYSFQSFKWGLLNELNFTKTEKRSKNHKIENGFNTLESTRLTSKKYSLYVFALYTYTIIVSHIKIKILLFINIYLYQFGISLNDFAYIYCCLIYNFINDFLL